MPNRSVPITLRAQALALLEEGVPVTRITEYTGLTKSTIYHIKRVAFERGYDPSVSYEFKDKYFVDGPRTGRFKVITEESNAQIIQTVQASREGREMTA
jgi:hypothetical protein